LVVVGSFAFVGFDGFFAASVGFDVVGAGADAAWVGLAPPVAGAADCVGVGAGAAGAGVAAVAAGVAIVFFGCWAALWRLACLALCVVLAFVAAVVVGVLVAAAGWALVVDFVEPPLPQPAATTATAATVQSRPRLMLAGLPFVCRNASIPHYKRISDYKGSQPLQGPIGAHGSYRLTAALHDCARSGARSQGNESMADANRAMR
jgi:hypothetical protein